MIYLIAQIIALLFVIFLLFIFFPTAFGAPFQPSSKKEIEKIIKLASPKKSDKIVDLGSGNGEIVIQFAKRGYESHGYEINPFLVEWSKIRIKRLGLSKKAFIHRQNFWKAPLEKYNIITLFQINYAMPKLKSKIQKECKRKTKVVSNTWKFPKLQPINKIGNVRLYEF